jgi:glycosyltransferase involved in cell wall biosynthesis
MPDDKQLKILILMAYYNRPILVKNALRSLVQANEFHQNWELLFGDDGSHIAGKPIVEEILGALITKVKFVQSNASFENKIANGLVLGKFANEAMKSTDSDVALILCDDDELHPTYLQKLSDFFIENSNVLYAYSKIHLYNPLLQKSFEATSLTNKYNQFNVPINPVGKLDASQVSWRLDCCKKYGAWFADSTKHVENKPWTKDTDRSFFENLHAKCGLCYPTGLVAQYKGIHDYQLLWHKNVQADQLKNYDNMCRELAGRKF